MKHPVYDTDRHFTVDPATGVLSSQMKKLTLVKGTHNSERFTFDFPRVVEGHDLSLCDKVEVHFLNINAATKETSKGTYKIDDIQVAEEDAETIVFSWLIDERVTTHAGPMSFSIHFKCLEGSKLLYRWPTAIFSGITISDGIDNGEALVEDYKDIVAAWMEEIEQSIGDTVKTAVDELVGDAVDQAVGEKVEPAVDKAIEDALQGSALAPSNYANALEGYASGTELVIDDLSPLASKLRVKVNGKQSQTRMMMRSAAPTATGGELVNLVPFPYQQELRELEDFDGRLGYSTNNVAFLVNADGSIEVRTTTDDGASSHTSFVLHRDEDTVAPFKTDTYYTRSQYDTGGVKFHVRRYGTNANSVTFLPNGTDSTKLPTATGGIDLYLLVEQGTILKEGVTVYPMIFEGQDVAMPSEFVPPVGAQSGDDHTHGDADQNHVCDSCGAVVSTCVDGDMNHVCDVCGKIVGEHKDNDGDGYCDYCGEPIIAVTLKIASADDPETIVETVVAVPSATVELTPIFPSMVITTDSEDVLLSAEYNRDTNKVVGNIETALDSIIAIQEGLIGGVSE